MRTSKFHAVLAAVAAVGIACPGPDDITPPVTEFEAELSSANVVPAPTNPSTGTATASFTLSGNDLAWEVDEGATLTSAITGIYLGQAAAGATMTGNTTQLTLCTACGADPHSGTLADLTDAQMNTLRTFGYNVTIRTSTNSTVNGEIRGQVRNIAP